MENKYWAAIEADITMPVEDFRYIMKMAIVHYDHTVNASAEVGGFLYGMNNMVGLQSLYCPEGHVNKQLSNRQVQLMYKAIEFDDSSTAARLRNELWKIITGFEEASKKANALFE